VYILVIKDKLIPYLLTSSIYTSYTYTTQYYINSSYDNNEAARNPCKRTITDKSLVYSHRQKPMNQDMIIHK